MPSRNIAVTPTPFCRTRLLLSCPSSAVITKQDIGEGVDSRLHGNDKQDIGEGVDSRLHGNDKQCIGEGMDSRLHGNDRQGIGEGMDSRLHGNDKQDSRFAMRSDLINYMASSDLVMIFYYADPMVGMVCIIDSFRRDSV